MSSRRLILFLALATCQSSLYTSFAAEFPEAVQVELQPFKAQVRRVIEAMDYLGFPIQAGEKRELEAALKESDVDRTPVALQHVLDRYALYGVHINPEMRVKVSGGPAKPTLHEQGWSQFLVKVHNEAGTTARLRAVSPSADSVFRREGDQRSLGSADDLWLDLAMFDAQPLTKTLTGLAVEYRILQLFSRDAGRREARMSFNVGQGTQDLGFRNDADVVFECQPARAVVLRVRDEAGEPATGSFTIRDEQQRVYPSQAKRLAPDFAFHPQIYRADRETVRLPAGTYTIEFERGPESVRERRRVVVGPDTAELKFDVKRWIDPSRSGWWSGDHHIHAAGCAHYAKPTEGVHAPDMMRHCVGEDLKVGANLTWGPCFDYQKQFFTGKIDLVSSYPYLLRYDVEVSGFGSHESGHLCLLRLKEQMFPGGESKHHWPKLGLNTLKWAKAQGAVVGPAHSGWGLEVDSVELPNYKIPPFDGIGANEYIMDVTHQVAGPAGAMVPAVDFISTVDTPYVSELNIWYHTLNVGYRTRISGETDFPCIYGERVGLGRSYVHLEGRLDYDAWCEGIRAGRNYVGDGRSHLMDFAVGGQKMGVGDSTLRLAASAKVKAVAKVAALLQEDPDRRIANLLAATPPHGPPGERPYWSIERARIGNSRKVAVELVVNGQSAGRQELVADGHIEEMSFDVDIKRSSWVALRILPGSHTNPVFIEIDGKPIRASRKSAEWCLAGVKQCRGQKARFMGPNEREAFNKAYDHAEAAYSRLIQECRTAEGL